MRGMGKIMYVICLMMCFCACGTRKVSTELTDYRKLVSELKELASSYERRTEVYKDSLMMMRGLMEKSSFQLSICAVILLCYTLGAAVAVMLTVRVNVMDILRDKE